MRVKDLPGLSSDRHVAAISERLTALDAADVMTDRAVGAVIVLREGHMAGFFTERDRMTRVVAARRDPAETYVAEVMTTGVVPVTLDDALDTCLCAMRDGGFRHLPIVDEDGEPFAMLSQRDFLTADAGVAAGALRKAAKKKLPE